jgi:hypothetical protein
MLNINGSSIPQLAIVAASDPDRRIEQLARAHTHLPGKKGWLMLPLHEGPKEKRPDTPQPIRNLAWVGA